MKKDESHKHLSVAPAEIFLAVVVKRETDFTDRRVLSDIHADFFGDSQKNELREPAASIDENNRRKRENQKRITRDENSRGDENSEESAPCVAHQNFRRLRVEPQIPAEGPGDDHDHDRPRRGHRVARDKKVIRDGFIANNNIKHHREHNKRNKCKRSRQTVDAVGTVRRVHRKPQQKCG